MEQGTKPAVTSLNGINEGDRFPLTLAEIGLVRSDARCSSEFDEADSTAADIDLPPTSIDDLLGPTKSSARDPSSLQTLAHVLPKKIVFECRNAFRDSLRLGNTSNGLKALEQGLDKLSVPGAHQNCSAWISSQIEILSDLGRFEPARELFPSLRSRQIDEVVILQPDDPDDWYEENYRKGELVRELGNLDLSVKAHDWQQGVLAIAQILEIDPAYFKIDSRKDQFTKCSQLYQLGLVEENLALEIQDQKSRFDGMEKALGHYCDGCYLTELFRTHLEHPQALITPYDHAICANLFFSAARVCIYLSDQKGVYNGSPQTLNYTLSLTAEDWRHQALDFLEMGRARVLNDLMRRQESVASSRKRKLPLAIPFVAREAKMIREEKAQRNHRLPSQPPPLLSASEDSASESDSAIDEDLPDPLSAVDPARLRARFSWERTLGDIKDPHLNTEVHLPPEARKYTEMRAKIPPTAAIAVYALASQCPQGLIILLLTSEGIETASWSPWNLSEVLSLIQHIADLQVLMDIESELSRKISATERLKRTDDIIEALSGLLICPIENTISSKKTLTIVPSGELAHVPWSLLILTRPKTCNMAVTAVPSFSIWHRLHTRSEKSQKLASLKPRISVVTNSPWRKSGRLRSIGYSRVEAFHIARAHDIWPMQADKIERSYFESQARSAQILHVSAHGSFNHKEPMLSRVHLFDGVTVLDLSKLAIKAELVVFSACLSGFSRAFDSGGTFSFAHTLLSTGTCAFIGTLWPVDDAATLLIMMIFYKKLRKGFSPADALRAAQMSMRSISSDDLFRLVDELTEMSARTENRARLGHYIYNPINRIQSLREQSVEKLQEPRCWAAFVLTGHGYIPVYGVPEVNAV